MARIKQLSKHLINQIAAGEVIERPASVVKELAENSIDAGASRVSIEITNDCRDIRVADNGSGIHPDDIMLAFAKHATSKIQNDEDLFDIHTLGFRGEALASIISISKLTCTTRTKDYDTGTKVKCENSEVKKVETGCAVGTIMEVKDLFYNLPVRLKFLRNPNTEFSYIQEIVQSLAIINTKVGFELKRNGKTVLKTTGQGDLAQTLKEVFSTDIVENLKPVSKTDELAGLKITGMVSKPDYTRSSKKNYHLYINSRSVKCPVMQKAVDTVYKTLIANSKYPFVVLNLEIPVHDVDVNVHPTKKEVRYKNPNQIFNFVMTAVEGGLANYTAPEIRPVPPQNVVKFEPVSQDVKIDNEATSGSKLLRLLFILISDDKEHFLSDLSKKLNCSRQTVIRLSTEIESVMGNRFYSGMKYGKRYYKITPNSTLGNLVPRQNKDLRYLNLCRELVDEFMPDQVKKSLDNFLLEYSISKQDLSNPFTSDEAKGHFSFYSKGYIDYTPHFEKIQMLLDAIESKQILSISYKAAGKKELRHHLFAPARILSMSGALYVFGALTTDLKTLHHYCYFSIHRIYNINNSTFRE